MKKEDKAIKHARLGLLEPEKVYEELITYKNELSSQSLNLDWVWDFDEKFEIELLNRDEPLIDLGLAQAAVSKVVVSTLWSKYENKNNQFELAIKVGILGGMNVSAIPTEYLVKILKGDYVIDFDKKDEMAYALLKNKHARRVVIEDFLKKKTPFDNISEDRIPVLLNAIKSNQCLNIDKSDSESPDLTYWGIRDGIFKMVNEAPVSENWLYSLYDLLGEINDKYHTLEEFDFPAFVKKWRDLPNEGSKTSDGYYTNLSFTEEFLCLVACLFGYKQFSKGSKFIEKEKSDVVYRCGYYSVANLSTKQISEAIINDGPVFIMSALYNQDLLLRKEKREIIEDALSGNLNHLYNARIKFLKLKYPWFKSHLVQTTLAEESNEDSSELKDAIDALHESSKAQNAELLHLKYIIYGLIIFAVIVPSIQKYF